MAGICCGVVGETEGASVEPSSRASRRRRLELRPFASVSDMAVPAPSENGRKRQKLDVFSIPSSVSSPDCHNAVRSRKASEDDNVEDCKIGQSDRNQGLGDSESDGKCVTQDYVKLEPPKFGMTSVCGRRRDMEDAVSTHASFRRESASFFGVFDGHGCSHVAFKCKDRLHEIVKEEIENFEDEKSVDWKRTMEKSFERMDKEAGEWSYRDKSPICRCEMQTPQCDAVGSTAVVAVVTPNKIVVSNCGDSRAVLCRNGVAIPLSSDHKPDRPDELVRIENAGGRVIYWDGARVSGFLAMSRAIGDNYLKPYVISEPEVTVTDRTEDDECLILASDGLWDVVSNNTACGVVRMCLRAQKPPPTPKSPDSDANLSSGAVDSSDKACSDASVLLTKLALARHTTDNVSVVVVDLRRNAQLGQLKNGKS
ncbi:hypothetical protein K2173_020436 [Erythroxylum novogranatense]|uniref:protein-serine/threonine phosphatase n=1 Tax=Erythroxylum novogranatense TaxID=1862640 RepID=A0AAV8TI78_9ROSI|nr:hypothetical protein K2173_020436 [Erythroxylum novogranatense]